MDMDVVFFGTSGSMPTADRAPTALMIRRGGERLLFDCAEGTQRQMLRSNVGLVDLREVFLTHYHADHYLGLPGMLKTFALRGREVPITIYGPPGLSDLFNSLRRIFGKLTYPYELVELSPGDSIAREDYRLVTFPVAHGVSSVGYALIEDDRPGRFDVETADALGVPNGPERGALQRGEPVTLAEGRVVTPDQVLGQARPSRTVVIAGDTAPAPSVLEAARGADLLVHDATFLEDERERAQRDRALDRAGGGRARARRGSDDARPHAPLQPLLRARGGARGARGLPRDGRPAGLRRHRDPLPGARRAPAAQRGRAPGRADTLPAMTRMVQVALAEDVTEAEEIQSILETAGISSELETAVEHHPRETEDAPQKVLVPESHLEAAQHAIESMTGPDEIVSDSGP